MKFEINTKTKTVVLLDKITFFDIDELKKFLGENFDEWVIDFANDAKFVELSIENFKPYFVPDVIWPYQKRWYILCLQPNKERFCISTNNAVVPTGFNVNKLK